MPRLPNLPRPFAGPAHGRSELSALRGASLAASRRGDPYAGTTHLVLELLADPSGPAARLLRLIDVDPEKVRADAQRRLPAIA
ncbi:Clp protease N-terminal domain-containing protein [Micromonospora sp. NPDC006431]|uniref:Clp protease N-terminal domain-containing protein n=1 Tax=Micromonospora sp. NPDC006431 TaxID=3364235 RepID=UPI0036761DA6